MRYHILAVDYDGTLATEGRVSSGVLAALIRLKATGRKLILVTGRLLEELQEVFPEYSVFDRVVAENGALLYVPVTGELKLLAEKPPEELITEMNIMKVPLMMGHVILATWEPHQEEALHAIMRIGLEYQLIFNKGAVMILPPGINKASGLLQALKSLDMSAHNVVAAGDAENDHAMLMIAEFSVAVSNALPMIKAIADWTSAKPCGEGVLELIDHLLTDDLLYMSNQIRRHDLIIGTKKEKGNFVISPYDSRMLLTGTSSCGKTTIATALVEKLVQKRYQLCLVDPEGDYSGAEGLVTVGTALQAPEISQVIQLLRNPEENLAICLLAVPLADRPTFFSDLLSHITILHRNSGHPHFLIIDEAHHLMPAEYVGQIGHYFEEIYSFLAVTTSSALLQKQFMSHVNLAMVMGQSRMEEVLVIAKTKGVLSPDPVDCDIGNVLLWQDFSTELQCVQTVMPDRVLKRHKRKYAAGDMGYNSFYFTGSDRKMHLKAQNLLLFIQIAEGIDDDTWLYHLRRHDYSNWFRYSIKDTQLATLSEEIERTESNAIRSKQAIFELIHSQYTAPG